MYYIYIIFFSFILFKTHNFFTLIILVTYGMCLCVCVYKQIKIKMQLA